MAYAVIDSVADSVADPLEDARTNSVTDAGKDSVAHAVTYIAIDSVGDLVQIHWHQFWWDHLGNAHQVHIRWRAIWIEKFCAAMGGMKGGSLRSVGE